MRMVMTRLHGCLACGRCRVTLLWGLQDWCWLCSRCGWLPARALYSRSLACLVREVTAPTLVGQVGGEQTGVGSLHGVGAQQTLAYVMMS